MYPSLNKIISDHRRIAREKGYEPGRLVDVWTDSEYYSDVDGRGLITKRSLVVTAYDLYASLFGDCAYSIFSGLKSGRNMNIFGLSSEYTKLTDGIKQYLTMRKCSCRVAFKDVMPKGLARLHELAYEITESRVWILKCRSLDPIYNPACPPPRLEIGNEALIYSQSLDPYLIKDVIGIILSYSVDVRLSNHLRCSKENQDGTRCNQFKVRSWNSCMKHKYNPSSLSNHYLHFMENG